MFKKFRINKIIGYIHAGMPSEELAECCRDLIAEGERGLHALLLKLVEEGVDEKTAEEALTQSFTSECIDAYLQVLNHERASLRVIFRDVLAQHIKEIPTEKLLNLCKTSGSFSSGKNLADLLILKNDPSCISSLIVLFSEVKDETVQRNILHILDHFNDRKIRDFLLWLIRKGNYNLRSKAIQMLSTYHDKQVEDMLLDMLQQKDIMMVRSAIECLGLMNIHTAAPKIASLLTHSDLQVRQKVVDALKLLKSPSVVSYLIHLQKEGDINARRLSLEILRNIEDPASVEVLVHALENDDWWIRELATDSLSRSPQKEIHELLRNFLRSDNSKVRSCAMTFFAQTPDPEVQEDLIALLQDPDKIVREKAVAGLSLLADPALFPKIEALVHDEEIRKKLPPYVAHYGEEKASRALKALLESGDDDAILASLAVIKEQSYMSMVPFLQELSEKTVLDVQEQILNTLLKMTGKRYYPKNYKGYQWKG